MRDKKKIIIGVLCVLVCIMAVGYAVLAQQLNITGTTSIDSTWKVEITNIQEKDIVGDATSKVTPSYTLTTANFSVGLIQPGDSITYDIEVTNSGTLDAVLENINVTTDENEAIKYTTSGMKRGDKLTKNGGKNTLTIKVEYDSSITSQPSITASDIAVTLNYQQDLGQVVVYDEYAIGDVVTFAGSNWYVIKNSSSEEDYVTLMKETTLTNAELGDYAYSDTDSIKFANYDVSPLNDYSQSYIKELLEGTYINTLGADNLKEIDGYKIRVILTDELIDNLQWTSGTGTSPTTEGNNVPIWVYNTSYWTMSPNSETTNSMWIVSAGNEYNEPALNSSRVYYDYNGTYNLSGVRPVINLLKSSI